MSEPDLIGPIPRSTSDDRRFARWRRRELPGDLLKEASRRLSIISLLGAVLWLVATGLGHLSPLPGSPTHGAIAYLNIPDGIAAGAVLVSVGLFLYARKSRRNPQFILDLGLGYMILTAFALGQMFHWPPLPTVPIVPMITWIGPVMLMFAAIVPSTPGKTLVAGLISASMMPIGMLIAKARGTWDFGPTINILVMHYPDYILVGVALVISHVVTRLSQHVTRAREMGSYRLGELLGRGGMGEVYRAKHRMLARPAAIKLIRPEMIGEGSAELAEMTLRRFRREAEVAASLRSPHTVALYDFGVTEDQTFYLVMEFLDGLDLDSLVREHGPIPAGRLIYLLRQVCHSLEEAHARGLVHRDIKPANIHVGRLGLEHDFVKVLDFGLVKSMADSDGGLTMRTAAGHMAGTPAYMAPEMALGRTIDGRTDLYALGCVAYFGLTGELVFSATNAFQMVAMHLQDEPPAPSRRAAAPPPPALDALVLACLAKNETRRDPLRFESITFASPVPLVGTSTSHEYHMDAASRESRVTHVTDGDGSSLFFFVRDWTPTGADPARKRTGDNPAQGLSLYSVGAAGERKICDLAASGTSGACRDPWAACTVEVRPGVYELRLELPSGEILRQSFVASADWQTQAFFLMRPFPSDAGRRWRADLPRSSVLLSRGSGFSADSRILRMSELARVTLATKGPSERGQTGRRLLANDVRVFLRRRFSDPMLGIYGAHLLLLEASVDVELLTQVVGTLRGMLGLDHPDVEALALPGASEPPAHPFEHPPMLGRSWSLIVAASVAWPDLVTDSLAEESTGPYVAEGPWHIRRSPSAHDGGDPDVFGLSSVEEALAEELGVMKCIRRINRASGRQSVHTNSDRAARMGVQREALGYSSLAGTPDLAVPSGIDSDGSLRNLPTQENVEVQIDANQLRSMVAKFGIPSRQLKRIVTGLEDKLTRNPDTPNVQIVWA